MKKYIIMAIVLFFVAFSYAQKNKGKMPTNIPPQYLEQMKKYMPAGTQLPAELTKMMNQSQNGEEQADQSFEMKPLVEIPPSQSYSFTPDASTEWADYSPFGSGRNEAQRKLALINVMNELNAKDLILPSAESVPSKAFMLKMAEERNKWAKQKFYPEDLTDYSRTVIWIPRFDGTQNNIQQAKENSILVALATNNKPAPYFNIAFASATFSLDPSSSVAANNLASAIISGGELICEKNPTKEALAIYRRDAEFGFLYAIFHSMKEDEWSEETLTPAINLGNLCVDLGRLEEARSLFMVARKIKPESWDAALGLAAYFIALNQKDKALAILEDDNLDKPMKYAIPIKHTKSLEKSEEFANLPPESPDEKYEAGIKIMNEEPIQTSADFVTQLDQSERNKMRYFIENLPIKGSYTVPKISKLTQYASLKAISSPQGISALEDFTQMLGIFNLGSYASTANQQKEWLEKLGMKIDITGVDMDDVAKHPEKYVDKDMDVDVKVSGKEQLMANIQAMKKDAEKAKLELATGKTEGLTKLVSKIDNLHTILLMNPDDYADPMNIIMQKINYTVYNRKTNLYRGYLQSLNKRTYNQVMEIVTQASRKINDLAKIKDAETKQFEEQKKAAQKAAENSGREFRDADWDLREHYIHEKFFHAANNIQEIAFGSATNLVSTAYVKKLKPNAEQYYYDVFRHIAMISDDEVRKQKEAEFKNSINQAVTMFLNTVLIAHGTFRYYDDWDCSCNLEQLLANREQEEKEMEQEEKEHIQRNKMAKAQFDSGEIPESSPLFKKLDSYVDEYNFGLIKVRASCARTVVEVNTDFLPNNLPFNFHYKSSESENTGAITRSGGVKVGIDKDLGAAKANMSLNLDVSVSSDGNGVIKDYSVAGGASAGVKVGNYSVSGGVSGTASSTNGVTDYSVSGNVSGSVKYGNTTVSGGASASYSMSKGLDTDFSAGVSQDFKNGLGGSATVKTEVSTKRGCSVSGKVNQTINPAGVQVQKDAVDKVKKDSGLKLNTDFFSKDLWSGKYEFKEKK